MPSSLVLDERVHKRRLEVEVSPYHDGGGGRMEKHLQRHL